MTLRFSSAGLNVTDPQARLGAAGWIDALLRGVGQVMLQNNAWTGLLFLLGVAWNSPLFAVAALLGTLASTATALWLGFDRAQLRNGLYGFNGALVAIALLVFLQPTALTWACVIVAAGGSTVVAAAAQRLLQVWDTSALTAPFVLVSWCMFLATARLGRLEVTGALPAAVLPRATGVEGVVHGSTIIDGVFNGIAQVFFQQNLVTGVILLLALLLASRRGALLALAGSLLGVLVAWGMGAAEPAIRSGAYGFNGVLVAIALASVWRAPGWRGIAMALLATLITPVVTAALSALVQPFGLPGLTLPFVLVTWVFLWAGTALPALHARAHPTKA